MPKTFIIFLMLLPFSLNSQLKGNIGIEETMKKIDSGETIEITIDSIKEKTIFYTIKNKADSVIYLFLYRPYKRYSTQIWFNECPNILGDNCPRKRIQPNKILKRRYLRKIKPKSSITEQLTINNCNFIISNSNDSISFSLTYFSPDYIYGNKAEVKKWLEENKVWTGKVFSQPVNFKNFNDAIMCGISFFNLANQ